MLFLAQQELEYLRGSCELPITISITTHTDHGSRNVP